MVDQPELINVHFSSGTTPATVFGQANAPVPILDARYCYKMRLDTVSFAADAVQHMRLFEPWDADFKQVTTYYGGLCDPTITADSTATQKWTGRPFLGVETYIGRSLGLAAIDIISVGTGPGGADVANDLRFEAFHAESNGCNGTTVMIRGPSGNNVRFLSGSKIETPDGCNPLIVMDGQSHMQWDGHLFGAGSGTAPAPFGAIAAGAAWKNYTNPGLVLAYNCASPKILGMVGYGNGTPSTCSPLMAFERFINSFDPQSNTSLSAGLDSLTPSGSARMIFDACQDVSTSRTRCYATPYALSRAGANQQERLVPNGTTTNP